MKKILSVVATVAFSVMVITSSVLTVNAADKANFTLRLESQTSSSVTVSINYNGGAKFNAVDFVLKTKSNKLALTCTEISKGTAYKSFSDYCDDNNANVFIQSNNKSGKIAFAATTYYRNISEDSDIVIAKYSKKSNATVKEGDITLSITNCAGISSSNSDVKKVGTKITYDFATLSNTKTSSSAKTDNDNGTDKNGRVTVSESDEASKADKDETVSSDNTDNTSTEKHSDEAVPSNNKQAVIQKKIKIIWIIAGILCAIGIAVVIIYSVMKKKNNTDV